MGEKGKYQNKTQIHILEGGLKKRVTHTHTHTLLIFVFPEHNTPTSLALKPHTHQHNITNTSNFKTWSETNRKAHCAADTGWRKTNREPLGTVL